jgi:hypothetical protein
MSVSFFTIRSNEQRLYTVVLTSFNTNTRTREISALPPPFNAPVEQRIAQAFAQTFAAKFNLVYVPEDGAVMTVLDINDSYCAAQITRDQAVAEGAAQRSREDAVRVATEAARQKGIPLILPPQR